MDLTKRTTPFHHAAAHLIGEPVSVRLQCSVVHDQIPTRDLNTHGGRAQLGDYKQEQTKSLGKPDVRDANSAQRTGSEAGCQ